MQPTAEILSCHEDLNAIQYNDEESYSFVPHITIAQKMSASEHDDILSSIKNDWCRI